MPQKRMPVWPGKGQTGKKGKGNGFDNTSQAFCWRRLTLDQSLLSRAAKNTPSFRCAGFEQKSAVLGGMGCAV